MRRTLSLLAASALLVLSGAAVAADEKADADIDSSPEAVHLRRMVSSIEDRLEEWDLPGAREELLKLEQAFADEPDALPVLLMQAKVSFYSGDYARAVSLFAQANASDADGSFRKLAEDALAETKDDAVAHGDHFDVYYPPGKDAVLVPYALETLEAAYAALVADFHFTPPGRIRVEILNDDEALSRLSTLTIDQIRTTGTIAICKFNRLMIISPKALLHGYAWRDTLNHEFVHYLVSIKSHNTVPIWLHEGLAKYEETRWRGPGGEAMTPAGEGLLGQAVKHDKLVTFEQMHPSMALLPSQELAATAFAEVFHAIEFLKKKGGTEVWNRAIDQLRDGASYQTAVSRAYGAPFTRFVSDWKAYLGTLKFPAELIPLESERKHFRDGGGKSKKKDAVDDTELADFSDISDESARQWAHLGGLLLKKNHPRAAIEEFTKAYARVGDKSVQLANRYADALFTEKRYDEAERLLRAAVRLHPEDEVAHLRLGAVLDAQKKPAEAVAEFMVAINTDPFDVRLHQGLAVAYRDLGQLPNAKAEEDAVNLLSPHLAEAAPKGEQGSVLLASHPFASVNVDGKELGRTTPTLLELPAGKHHLKLVNAEYSQSKELDVEVAAGQQQDLRVELEDQRRN